jgi:hypothetical protein
MTLTNRDDDTFGFAINPGAILSGMALRRTCELDPNVLLYGRPRHVVDDDGNARTVNNGYKSLASQLHDLDDPTAAAAVEDLFMSLAVSLGTALNFAHPEDEAAEGLPHDIAAQVAHNNLQWLKEMHDFVVERGLKAQHSEGMPLVKPILHQINGWNPLATAPGPTDPPFILPVWFLKVADTCPTPLVGALSSLAKMATMPEEEIAIAQAMMEAPPLERVGLSFASKEEGPPLTAERIAEWDLKVLFVTMMSILEDYKNVISRPREIFMDGSAVDEAAVSEEAGRTGAFFEVVELFLADLERRAAEPPPEDHMPILALLTMLAKSVLTTPQPQWGKPPAGTLLEQFTYICEATETDSADYLDWRPHMQKLLSGEGQ